MIEREFGFSMPGVLPSSQQYVPVESDLDGALDTLLRELEVGPPTLRRLALGACGTAMRVAALLRLGGDALSDSADRIEDRDVLRRVSVQIVNPAVVDGHVSSRVPAAAHGPA